jgi:predicted metalloprotease with PDZ domain
MNAKLSNLLAAGWVSILSYAVATPVFAIQQDVEGNPVVPMLKGVTAEEKCGITAVETGGLGVKITQVTPAKPCAKAGLEVDDNVISINGHLITTLGALDNEIALATGPTPFVVQDHNTNNVVQIVVVFP